MEISQDILTLQRVTTAPTGSFLEKEEERKFGGRVGVKIFFYLFLFLLLVVLIL
jgi:hypothetical protein